MDIEGAGWAVLTQLLERGMVQSRADFFRLTVEDLEWLERFARKSAENLYAGSSGRASAGRSRASSTASGCRRSASRRRSTSRTGSASACAGRVPAGRRRRGPTRGSRRSRPSSGGSRTDEPERFTEVAGIGPTVAAALGRWFADTATRDILASWSRPASCPERPAVRPPGEASAGPLAGKTLVVTGTLEGFSRPEAEEAIRAAGGKPGGIGVEEDRLPGRGRERRLEAGEGPGARRARPRRGRVPARARRRIPRRPEQLPCA